MTINEAQKIQVYLKQNIAEPLKLKSDELFPVVTRKIDDICTTWLEHVKEAAAKEKFSTQLLPKNRYLDPFDSSALQGIPLIDKEGAELLTNIFKERYDIHCEYEVRLPLSDIDTTNFLADALPPGDLFDVTFYWSPLNPVIYEKKQLFDNITSDIVENNSIQTYLKRNIAEPLKPKSDEFVPVVTVKIDDICKTWLEHVKEAAAKEKFSIQLLPKNRYLNPFDSSALQGIPLIDKAGAELLTNIFKERYDIHCEYEVRLPLSDIDTTNTLADVLPPGDLFDVTFYWSPLNTTVYEK